MPPSSFVDAYLYFADTGLQYALHEDLGNPPHHSIPLDSSDLEKSAMVYPVHKLYGVRLQVGRIQQIIEKWEPPLASLRNVETEIPYFRVDGGSDEPPYLDYQHPR